MMAKTGKMSLPLDQFGAFYDLSGRILVYLLNKMVCQGGARMPHLTDSIASIDAPHMFTMAQKKVKGRGKQQMQGKQQSVMAGTDDGQNLIRKRGAQGKCPAPKEQRVSGEPMSPAGLVAQPGSLLGDSSKNMMCNGMDLDEKQPYQHCAADDSEGLTAGTAGQTDADWCKAGRKKLRAKKQNNMMGVATPDTTATNTYINAPSARRSLPEPAAAAAVTPASNTPAPAPAHAAAAVGISKADALARYLARQPRAPSASKQKKRSSGTNKPKNANKARHAMKKVVKAVGCGEAAMVMDNVSKQTCKKHPRQPDAKGEKPVKRCKLHGATFERLNRPKRMQADQAAAAISAPPAEVFVQHGSPLAGGSPSPPQPHAFAFPSPTVYINLLSDDAEEMSGADSDAAGSRVSGQQQGVQPAVVVGVQPVAITTHGNTPGEHQELPSPPPHSYTVPLVPMPADISIQDVADRSIPATNVDFFDHCSLDMAQPDFPMHPVPSLPGLDRVKVPVQVQPQVRSGMESGGVHSYDVLDLAYEVINALLQSNATYEMQYTMMVTGAVQEPEPPTAVPESKVDHYESPDVSLREQKNFLKAVMSGIPLVDKSAVTVGSKIGEGGYGLVARARVAGMDGDKVVKKMQMRHSHPADAQELLLEEAVMSVAGQEAGVVACQALVTYKGRLVGVIYPYFEGGDCKPWLQRLVDSKPASWKELCEQVASGTDRLRVMVSSLGKLHKMKIGHFDVKPANVLADGRLIDPGMAQWMSEQGVYVTRAMGTPAYCSPEMMAVHVNNQPAYVGPPSDVYSAGMTVNSLYNKLCVMVQKGGVAARLLSVLPRLEMIIKPCLLPNPVSRPTADQLLDQLTQFAAYVRSKAA